MLWDLVVVGAGPAGAVAALSARRARPAAHVLLVDKADFPRDKACGDGIAPQVDDQLRALGAPTVLADAPGIPGLRLTAPSGAAVARPPARPAHVVPRAVFDARLVDAARDAGAELRRARVRGLCRGPGQVTLDTAAGTIDTRVVVAADGVGSTLRRALGVAANPPGHLAVAVRGYAPSGDGPLEQHIVLDARDWPAYAWSFPTGTGATNVGYGVLRNRLRGGRTQLRGRLAELMPDLRLEAGSLRAAHLPLSSWRPDPAHGRVLLAGDAASLVNPLTGEGIYYAVVSGRLAGAAAVTAPDPGAAYRRDLRRALGRHLRLTALVAAALRRPAVVEAAIGVARDDQDAFDELVDVGLSGGMLSLATMRKVAARGLGRPRLRQDAA